MGGGGGGPSDLTPRQPWLYVLGKAEHRSPIVETCSVSKGYTYWSIGHLLQGGRVCVCVCGGGGDNFCGRETISASGLRPWGTISASRLCPGGQNLRGDRICSDTGSARSRADQPQKADVWYGGLHTPKRRGRNYDAGIASVFIEFSLSAS